MTTSSLSVPVKVELQDAADTAGLPGEDDWARWVCEALTFVEQRAEHGVEEGVEGGITAIGNVTVRLVGDDESQHLNSTYRNKSGATNVLAFSGPQDPMLVPDEDRELGDIVICLPVVYREARDQGKQAVAHMAHMAVHGTLHLLGFDHDNEADARRMEDVETRILSRLGFPDPYATR
jgi:probable rRNA maturation factor